MQDYIIGTDNDLSDEHIFNFALFVDCDPITYKDAASNDGRWIHAMDGEIHFIEKNKIWELISLLVGK